MFLSEDIKQVFNQGIFTNFTGDNAEATAYFLVECIGLAGAAFIAVSLFQWRLHARRLIKINKKLSAYHKNASSAYEARKAFAKDFDSVEELFEKTSTAKSFRHHWLEFKETLIIPDIADSEEMKPIQNSLRPFEFFHYSDIKWSPRIFSAWPNVFVGIGLLLTFIGLAAAIGEAAAGVASTNVAEAQASLEKVLNAAKVKFLTSIAGLGVSIFLGLILRATGWDISRRIYQLCENLERNMLYEFSENIQQRQLTHLEQQTQALKQFTDNFAVNLGEELEKRLNSVLTTSFKQAMAPLNEAVKEQLAKADSRGAESVEKLVRQLSDNINSGTNDQMTAIVQSLGEVREVLGATTENLSKSLSGGADAISQQMTEAGKEFSNSITEIKSLVGNITENFNQSISSGSQSIAKQMTDAGRHFSNEVHDIVGTMANSINRFDAGVGELDSRLRTHAELLDSKIKAVQDTIPELITAANALNTASQPIASTAEKFDAASRAIHEVSNSFDETRTHLRETANIMMETQQKTGAAWEEYRMRFEGVDENLAKIFEEYGKHIQGSQETMRTFVADLDSSFAKAGKSLSIAVQELRDLLEELPEEIKKAV